MLTKQYRLTGKEINYILRQGGKIYGKLFIFRVIPQYPNHSFRQRSIQIPVKLDKRASMRNMLKRVAKQCFVELAVQQPDIPPYKVFIFVNKQAVDEWKDTIATGEKTRIVKYRAEACVADFTFFFSCMSSIIDQFSELISQTKRLVKQLKKKKSKSHQEIIALEEALSRQTDAPSITTPILPIQDAWKFWLVGVSAVFVGYFVFQSLDILYLILAGFILSMALEHVISWLQRRFSRGFSILTAYVLLLVFLLSGLIIVVPFVVQQVADIINVLIGKVNIVQDMLQNDGLIAVINSSGMPSQLQESLLGVVEDGNWIESIQASLAENISQIVSVGSDYITNAGALAVSIVAGFFSAFVQVSIVFIVAIFFTIEKEKVVHFLARISGNFSYTELKLKKLYMKLGFRLKGQLLLCLIIALLVGIGLTVFGRFGMNIPNKFTLALIAGLTEFVPYVGPFLGMIPAVMLGGLAYGRGGILAMVLLYWAIQQSENNIIVPAVMSQTLGVSPLLIFLCMVLGGSLFGLLGIVLAVPFAVIVNILFEDYKTSVQQPLDNNPRK